MCPIHYGIGKFPQVQMLRASNAIHQRIKATISSCKCIKLCKATKLVVQGSHEENTEIKWETTKYPNILTWTHSCTCSDTCLYALDQQERLFKEKQVTGTQQTPYTDITNWYTNQQNQMKYSSDWRDKVQRSKDTDWTYPVAMTGQLTWIPLCCPCSPTSSLLNSSKDFWWDLSNKLARSCATVFLIPWSIVDWKTA